MNRLSIHDFASRETALLLSEITDGRHVGGAAGLLITCTAECFPPEDLERVLAPGKWLVHRNPGNIVPAYGTGHREEERLLERAVEEVGIDTLVVCGHLGCEIAAHLLTPDAPTDDLLMRDWLSHADAARRCIVGSVASDEVRVAVIHNILAQLVNLHTHPAVAAAQARGCLDLRGWLYGDALYYSSSTPTAFDRLVLLQPDQNRHLRQERGQQRLPALPSFSPPYLA